MLHKVGAYFFMVGPVGIEPTTPGLKGRRSTTELRTRGLEYHTKYYAFCCIMSMDMNIIEDSKKLALLEIEKFNMPFPIHFDIAECKAVELIKSESVDQTIVMVGLYLMDLKLGQAFKDGRLKDHVKMSSDAAKEFLKKYDLGGDRVNKIINCIEAHHKEVPFICKEAEVCANADCYRFIHPKGFFAYLNLLGVRNNDFYESLNLAEAKLDEKYKILSLDICKKELEEPYQQLKKLINQAREL